MFTSKQVKGFMKAWNEGARRAFGGITLNDDYNMDYFGITHKEYTSVLKYLDDTYGMTFNWPQNLSAALKRKAS